MSWLKFDTATPEKPEVFAITIALGWEDPDLTVGKLLKVWRWFDLHSVDGNASSVTLALLDRLIGVTGLSQAMVDVGWLEVSDNGLTLPNFENHNGKTAKDRALTAKRASNYRSNDKSNAQSVTNALPREEKRREEKKEEKTVDKTTRGSRLSIHFEPDLDFAKQNGITNPSEELAKFRDYWNSQAGAKAVKTDWHATWRNWCRNSRKDVARPNYEPPYAKYMREKVEKMSPSIAAPNPNNPNQAKRIDPNEFLRTIEAQNVIRIN
jgi:hypothetical protein